MDFNFDATKMLEMANNMVDELEKGLDQLPNDLNPKDRDELNKKLAELDTATKRMNNDIADMTKQWNSTN